MICYISQVFLAFWNGRYKYINPIQLQNYTWDYIFSLESCFCPICIENVEFGELCENIIKNYVKYWRHIEINPNGKMPIARFEELESKDISISSDDDRIQDLIREGNVIN